PVRDREHATRDRSIDAPEVSAGRIDVEVLRSLHAAERTLHVDERAERREVTTLSLALQPLGNDAISGDLVELAVIIIVIAGRARLGARALGSEVLEERAASMRDPYGLVTPVDAAHLGPIEVFPNDAARVRVVALDP